MPSDIAVRPTGLSPSKLDVQTRSAATRYPSSTI
jgi:hypothetical protein